MPKEVIVLFAMTGIVLAGLIATATFTNLSDDQMIALYDGAGAFVIGALIYVIAYTYKGLTKKRSFKWGFGSFLILGSYCWIFIMASCITASYSLCKL